MSDIFSAAMQALGSLAGVVEGLSKKDVPDYAKELEKELEAGFQAGRRTEQYERAMWEDQYRGADGSNASPDEIAEMWRRKREESARRAEENAAHLKAIAEAQANEARERAERELAPPPGRRRISTDVDSPEG